MMQINSLLGDFTAGGLYDLYGLILRNHRLRFVRGLRMPRTRV